MLYVDSTGKFYTEEEVANLSSLEFQIRRIHVYIENKEKQLIDGDQEKNLFHHMDEMIA